VFCGRSASERCSSSRRRDCAVQPPQQARSAGRFFRGTVPRFRCNGSDVAVRTEGNLPVDQHQGSLMQLRSFAAASLRRSTVGRHPRIGAACATPLVWIRRMTCKLLTPRLPKWFVGGLRREPLWASRRRIRCLRPRLCLAVHCVGMAVANQCATNKLGSSFLGCTRACGSPAEFRHDDHYRLAQTAQRAARRPNCAVSSPLGRKDLLAK
jgi:hypothetical protein